MKQFILSFAVLCTVGSLAVGCSDDDSSIRYSKGDIYDRNGVRGVVFAISDEGRHGLIVSLDETTAAWSTEQVRTAAVSDSDGAANQAAIESIADWQTKYPAFAWCDAKNVNGASNWFLPAYDQLRELYNTWSSAKSNFNKALTDSGGMAIAPTSAEDEYYWSSTDDESSSGGVYAVAFMFRQGVADFPFKTDHEKVRAVHAF